MFLYEEKLSTPTSFTFLIEGKAKILNIFMSKNVLKKKALCLSFLPIESKEDPFIKVSQFPSR